MDQESLQPTEKSPVIMPNVGACYSHGWRQMWKSKYGLELLLIFILSFLISIPSWGLSIAEKIEDKGAGVFFLVIFSLAYKVLIQWPIEYGVSFASLKAARGDRLEVKNMFDVFQNYINAVLAYLLTISIVVVGFLFLIIPGIIFACKFAFVPYLIVDRKMKAVEAVKESWRMTTGHALTIFFMGFLAIFIFIAGFVCLIVGIIPAIIWIQLASASLYHAVSTSETELNLQTNSN